MDTVSKFGIVLLLVIVLLFWIGIRDGIRDKEKYDKWDETVRLTNTLAIGSSIDSIEWFTDVYSMIQVDEREAIYMTAGRGVELFIRVDNKTHKVIKFTKKQL